MEELRITREGKLIMKRKGEYERKRIREMRMVHDEERRERR